TITLTQGELFIWNEANLTIQGPGAGLLAISGNNSSRVFEVGSFTSNITISGLTIEGGNGHNYTDGINVGFYGGGILNDSGSTLSLNGCTVTGNHALYSPYTAPVAQGGGIYNASHATLTMTGCTVTSNSVGQQNPWSNG